VRVVVSLFNETQLLALRLVESMADVIGLFETLERQYKQLGIVLVRERRERNGCELARFQPVN
jgi:hypothetical protein